MLLLSPILLAMTVSISHVAAHGVVISFTANGKTYTGEPSPDQPTGAASPIRAVINNGPVVDVTNTDLTCGKSATVAAMDVPIDAGSVATVQWTEHWPHKWGPIITYLASCDEACSKVTDPTTLSWFKVDQLGASNTSDSIWLQETLPYNSKPIEVTIPDNLKPGYYMMRHEIIALHNAKTEGLAEFYPQCIQMEVKGTGSLVPSPSDMVRFPGAYQAGDPGIKLDVFTPIGDENVYDIKKHYLFPGGPIPRLTPDSGNAGNSTPPSASTSIGSTTATATGLPTTSATATAVTSSSRASESVLRTDVSTPATQTLPTASASGTCHAKRGSIKRRL